MPGFSTASLSTAPSTAPSTASSSATPAPWAAAHEVLSQARPASPASPAAPTPSALPALPGWELFAHGADVGVRGFGRTKAEAFEQAGMALTAAITDPSTVRANNELSISCSAGDDELLLLAWLNRLVTEMSLRGMLFSSHHVTLSAGELHARVAGERINLMRHHPAVEVKGATPTELRVALQPDGLWVAQTVVDV